MGFVKRQMENDIDQWYRDVGEIFHEGHKHLGDFLSEVLHRNPHPNPNIPTREVEEELEEFWEEKWSMLR